MLRFKSQLTYFNYCYAIETGYASIVHNVYSILEPTGLIGKRLSELTNSADNDCPLHLLLYARAGLELIRSGWSLLCVTIVAHL
jgi:hypothetical protein